MGFLGLRVLATGFLSTTPIPYWFVCTAGLLGVKEAAFIWTRAAVDLLWAFLLWHRGRSLWSGLQDDVRFLLQYINKVVDVLVVRMVQVC